MKKKSAKHSVLKDDKKLVKKMVKPNCLKGAKSKSKRSKK